MPRMIKPIYRIAGSKYKLLKHILPLLEKYRTVVDVFGGSGIVSVNLQERRVPYVIFNNYDKIDFFSDRVLVNNILQFDGYGSITKLAGQNLATRVKNGYWDRVDLYREKLGFIKIISVDYKTLEINPDAAYYLDPPYFMEEDKFYKNRTEGTDFYNWSLDLAKRVKRVVISMPDTPEVRAQYHDWEIREIKKHVTIGKGKKRRKMTELLIISKNEGDDNYGW